jgi:hypothetical protein
MKPCLLSQYSKDKIYASIHHSFPFRVGAEAVGWSNDFRNPIKIVGYTHLFFRASFLKFVFPRIF